MLSSLVVSNNFSSCCSRPRKQALRIERFGRESQIVGFTDPLVFKSGNEYIITQTRSRTIFRVFT